MTRPLDLPQPVAPTAATREQPQPANRQVELEWAAYLGQRLLFALVVLGALTYLTFLGLEMAGGASLRESMGPALQQSLAYAGHLLRGDLGLTKVGIVTPRAEPVADLLWGVVSRSLALLGAALLLAVAVGVPLGMLAARRRHSNTSLLILLLSIVGVSIPSFFAALLLQMLMIRWARISGSPPLPIGGFGFDKHLVLPALVLAARPVAQITRVTFIAIGNVLDADYLRTAISKGLWPRQIWTRHVLRNAAIPILTTVGLSLRFALSSLPVVEFFFGWPGIGFTLLKSIARQDDNLTVALILTLGLLFILVNLALDLSYRMLDPQQRAAVTGGDRRSSTAGLARRISNGLDSLGGWMRRLSPRRWLAARRAPSEPNPFRRVAEQQTAQLAASDDSYRRTRRRASLRGIAGNLPLLLGAAIIAGLLAAVLFGPRLAPHSPYTTQGLSIVDGQFRVPPFAPDAVHPWGSDVLGRDIQSLVLAGAQQTLILAVLAVLARLVVGFVLGALAGWRSGGWLDHAIMGASEIIAAYPALVLAMVVILALGIRQGMRPFIIALCLVGWGEVMQFVRGEVMAIRLKPYIESAVAVGVRTSRMLLTHVLPLLLAALISLAALEMGAVLMLLGELGFVGIFIGGGAFAELQVGSALYHYSDVPEWASLLSSIRLYARSYPWMALYPAAAFFIAILGFNLFSEGLRRMVERVGVGFTWLFNRYALLVVGVAVLLVYWARANTGAIAVYRQQAAQFSGQQALALAETLSDPAQDNRALGAPGLPASAAWIADQMKATGAQPAGQDLTYFQNRLRAFTSLEALPTLQIDDGGAAPIYRQDFKEMAGRYSPIGQASGPVTALLAGAQQRSNFRNPYPRLQQEVDRDAMVLAVSDRTAAYLQDVTVGGLLVVPEDALDLQRNATLASRPTSWDGLGTNQGEGKPIPRVLISEATANRLLRSTGQTVAGLRAQERALSEGGVGLLPAAAVVSLAIPGSAREGSPAQNVLGYIPGASGRAQPGEGQMDAELVVVLAQYDSPPAGPDGCCPAANDNASGVAVMLEAMRTLQESGYQPYRTLLFVAYSGEGLDGGEPVNPKDIYKFLQAKQGWATTFDPVAVVSLRGLGAGAGKRLMLSAGGNQRLAQLFERAARQMGVPTARAEEAVDISIVFTDRSSRQGGGQEAPDIDLSWQGWQSTARTSLDIPEALSAEQLEQAGQTLALALMVMGRENRF